jgi:hypothetical protein
MQVGGIIGKGGLTPMWYIRFGVMAGCDWAKKMKNRATGARFGVEGTKVGVAGVSGAGGGGGGY